MTRRVGRDRTILLDNFHCCSEREKIGIETKAEEEGRSVSRQSFALASFSFGATFMPSRTDRMVLVIVNILSE